MQHLIIIEALFAAARLGDTKAENELFKLLHERIMKLVKNRVRSFYKHPTECQKDVEDLAAEIDLFVFENYKDANFSYGFFPWVMKVARNKIGVYYRRQKVQNRIICHLDFESLPFAQMYNEVNFETALQIQELQQAIAKSVKKLPDRYQKIARVLLHGRIKEYMKVQKKKRIKINTIYSQIHRCRGLMLDMINQAGFEV